jgi:hypothetical protein
LFLTRFDKSINNILQWKNDVRDQNVIFFGFFVKCLNQSLQKHDFVQFQVYFILLRVHCMQNYYVITFLTSNLKKKSKKLKNFIKNQKQVMLITFPFLYIVVKLVKSYQKQVQHIGTKMSLLRNLKVKICDEILNYAPKTELSILLF